MSTFMDIVMSSIIFGILALTVGRLQININNSMYQTKHTIVVQSNSCGH